MENKRKDTNSELLELDSKSLDPRSEILEKIRINPTQGKKEGYTFKVAAPSQLLSRLESFLPQLQKANEELFSEIKNESEAALSSTQIDDQEKSDQVYVEMDLGLGVFDVKGDSNITESMLAVKQHTIDESLYESSTDEDTNQSDMNVDGDGDATDRASLVENLLYGLNKQQHDGSSKTSGNSKITILK
ncbi:hypothetical protein AX774_g2056 [Zancudomyces culisetae]|uniref:Uncharacterized protein n=1 Tax=Zancudomyces culisetae TaxID=1213189 RepID=A0A1R1PTU3_ZANCU|nr:hypothetical protein AX774_g2056 [Zancudomyces culisetae]|eukprot:OMH84416.1 hypothetical protein AX774_g2056 [Zancudomyces culisetae]